MLNDTLLYRYMKNFFGYGNLNGHYWFVGIEEGSDGTNNEIENRLLRWKKRGKHHVENIVKFSDVDRRHWFNPDSPLQTTWKMLIRIQLSAEGVTPENETIRRFQCKELGRPKSDNCLLELLPLPSRTTSDWIYDQHSNIPELRTREEYENVWKPRRAAILRNLINRPNPPRCIVFYSRNNQDSWEEIVHGAWRDINDPQVRIAHNQRTLFIITRHPTAYGASNGYFDRVGQLIRENRA